MFFLEQFLLVYMFNWWYVQYVCVSEFGSDVESDDGFKVVGDIIVTAEQARKQGNPHVARRRAVAYERYRWFQGVIPYKLSDNIGTCIMTGTTYFIRRVTKSAIMSCPLKRIPFTKCTMWCLKEIRTSRKIYSCPGILTMNIVRSHSCQSKQSPASLWKVGLRPGLWRNIPLRSKFPTCLYSVILSSIAGLRWDPEKADNFYNST